MLTAACLVIDGRGEILSVVAPPPVATLRGLLCLPANPAQPATFFTAAAYRSGGGLDRRYDLAMDIDLWLKLAKVGPIRTLPSEVLARYREHPNAKSIARAAGSARQSLGVRRRHGMPLRSRAAVALIQAGYIRPVVSPVTRKFRRMVRRLMIGPADRVSKPAP
jgi:hypothetical protein